MKSSALAWVIALLSSHVLFAESPDQEEFAWEDYYDIVSVPLPDKVDPQIGGLDLTATGEIAACFHRGEVMIFNPDSKQWRPFASGLHEPLGIYVEEEGTILVIQRSELTRLHDKDQDGLADFYEVVSNDWGVSGNYHEFTFGLVKDSKKNIYIALGTASNMAGVREEVRGPWNETGGLAHADFLYGGKHGDWKEKRERVPRMYARVPYRGCVLRISPGSSKAEVFATGLRTPNGLYMDADDQLWVSDNQGDWVGASKLHRIQEGSFHGHAASLLWGENPPNEVPANLPLKELDRRRTKAAALLPQGDCGNSLTQILDYRETFGPSGSNKDQRLIVGDMNHSRIPLYLPDMVKGQHQGASTHLLATNSLGMGNNRLLYSPDGKSLYLGKTHLSWPGREGIKVVTYNGKPYLQAESVKLTPDGFVFTFNADVEAPQDPEAYKIESYRIAYHASYGSKKNELESESCANVSVRGRVLSVKLSEKPKANRVYDIILPKEITSQLSQLSSNRYWYTAHEVY
ncbi:hypothetical protein [Haloferula sp.]|uniref:hypothetical protein n=1 Tax=Haloferula sp. TaxID=2497595 RepID=UPI00329B6CF0